MTAFELLRERLEQHGCKLRVAGRQMTAQCPAHEDQKPSLCITNGNERVLVKCQAGCDTDDILTILKLARRDLYDHDKDDAASPYWQNGSNADGLWNGQPIIAKYDYVDENGHLLFQVCRTPEKQFPQRVPDGRGGWRWRLGNTRRVPFNMPLVLTAVNAGEPVWITEGEKDAIALQDKGDVVATCNPGGAGKWLPEFNSMFQDATVTIVADRDKAGEAHARNVARNLRPVARSVRIVEAAQGKDAWDHLNAGLTLDEFMVTAPSEEAGLPDLAPDLHEFLAKSFPAEDWVVEGLLERGDRFILTGGEGRGKSLLSRQIAVAAAAGLSPFNLPTQPRPMKVLVIDCENDERKSQRHYKRLLDVVDRAGSSVPTGGLRLIFRPEGLDLFKEDDTWLLERVTAHQPDLLVIGPLYRLHVIDVNEETAARAVANALDTARLAVSCALLLEAHAPHEESRGKRVLRPAGSSLFLRWPELGYGLRATGSAEQWEQDHVCSLEQWRGPRDARPDIPRRLKWGMNAHAWPWVPDP